MAHPFITCIARRVGPLSIHCRKAGGEDREDGEDEGGHGGRGWTAGKGVASRGGERLGPLRGRRRAPGGEEGARGVHESRFRLIGSAPFRHKLCARCPSCQSTIPHKDIHHVHHAQFRLYQAGIGLRHTDRTHRHPTRASRSLSPLMNLPRDNASMSDPLDPWPVQSLPTDRKSTRLNSSHSGESRMPSSA